jgi:hypothetical protein
MLRWLFPSDVPSPLQRIFDFTLREDKAKNARIQKIRVMDTTLTIYLSEAGSKFSYKESGALPAVDRTKQMNGMPFKRIHLDNDPQHQEMYHQHEAKEVEHHHLVHDQPITLHDMEHFVKSLLNAQGDFLLAKNAKLPSEDYITNSAVPFYFYPAAARRLLDAFEKHALSKTDTLIDENEMDPRPRQNHPRALNLRN